MTAVHSQWMGSIRHSFMGRELPRLMTSAGMTNIQTSGYLLATHGLPEVNLIYDLEQTALSQCHPAFIVKL